MTDIAPLSDNTVIALVILLSLVSFAVLWMTSEKIGPRHD